MPPNTEEMEKVLFKETQTNIILVVAFAIVSVCLGVVSAKQMLSHQIKDSHQAPDWLLLFFFMGGVLASVFFYLQKLRVLITENKIQINFGFLSCAKVIVIKDLKSITLRKYNGIKEFMGWGVRYNGNTSCFTVSGDDAVEIELSNNDKVLIGTHDRHQMQLILEKYFHNKTV